MASCVNETRLVNFRQMRQICMKVLLGIGPQLSRDTVCAIYKRDKTGTLLNDMSENIIFVTLVNKKEQ